MSTQKTKCDNCWEGSGVVSVDVNCPSCMGPLDIRLHDNRGKMHLIITALVEWKIKEGGKTARCWKNARRFLSDVHK